MRGHSAIAVTSSAHQREGENNRGALFKTRLLSSWDERRYSAPTALHGTTRTREEPASFLWLRLLARDVRNVAASPKGRMREK